MTTSYITTHFPPDDPYYQDEGKDEAHNDLKPYMNNFLDNHSFYEYHYKDLADEGNYSSDLDYANAVASAIDDKGELTKNETIICFHETLEWGYGVAKWTSKHSERCLVIAVYAGFYNTNWETRGFVWHEFGHSAADHVDAEYDVDSNGYMHSITPMAMSYLQDADGDWDTNYGNDGGDTPGPFCWSEDNQSHNHKSDLKAAHDLGRYASCTRDKLNAEWD